MIKLDFPRAPLVLALVLAPLLETSLRQSLLLSFGSPMIFVERPLSAVLLGLVLVSLAVAGHGRHPPDGAAGGPSRRLAVEPDQRDPAPVQLLDAQPAARQVTSSPARGI